MYKILIVEDNARLRAGLEDSVRSPDRRINAVGSLDDAVIAMNENDYDLVITDLLLGPVGGPMEGFEVIEHAKRKNPATQVIVITQYGDIDIGVQSMLLGAFDYIERNVPGVDEWTLVQSKAMLALNYKHQLDSGRVRGQEEDGRQPTG